MSILIDPRFRAARYWSNRELKKVLEVIDDHGSVVNVSGWRDSDKEGGTYRSEYFHKASDYHVTNWMSEARGMQGDIENEIFLDLEEVLASDLIGKYDIVFNHTTLEHIFDVSTAFENLCLMSKNLVIIVVPFLQEQHANYGDYWRFTPQVIKKLFSKYGFKAVYISANDDKEDAIYVFAVGVKKGASLANVKNLQDNLVEKVEDEQSFIGIKHMKGSIFNRLIRFTLYKIGYLKDR
jgi:hypothetical protein